jgi:glycolate oxidase iron-sulfur subunit
LTSLAPLEPLMDKCVHCGFCLPSCPSYVLLSQEMDSPRGRIYLMRAAVEGRSAVSAAFVGHFDTCLGCMACETACPSGVRYAPLIEETRAAIEAHHTRTLSDRMFRRALFALLPHPRRLRAARMFLGAARALRRWPGLVALLPHRLGNLLMLAPDRATPGEVAERTPAAGVSRREVGLVTGCVQRAFFGDVNQQTVRVLAAEGCTVHAPSSQGCCGALALHAGRNEDARAMARSLVASFDAVETTTPLDEIVVNAAGCGSAIKGYAELLKYDPVWAARARAFAAKVRDLSETLTGLDSQRAVRHPLPLRVAYHDACHLAHAQGVRQPPRQLLATIPELTLVPVSESELCCGSAGIFNLVEPGMAAELGRRKAARLAEARPDLVITSNPGCLLQIAAAARASGHQYRVAHLAEVLDASLTGSRRLMDRF